MPPFDLISLLSKKTKILIKCTTFIIHDWVNQLLYKTVGTIKYIVAKIKLTQIYRNLLLTERYREVENLKDSYSVVLSPKEHPSTEKEIRSVTEYLKPEYAYKLSAVTLEDFVDTMIQCLPEYYAQVYERFRERYLEFE